MKIGTTLAPAASMNLTYEAAMYVAFLGSGGWGGVVVISKDTDDEEFEVSRTEEKEEKEEEEAVELEVSPGS